MTEDIKIYRGNDPQCIKMQEYIAEHNPIMRGFYSIKFDEIEALADIAERYPVQAVSLAFFYGQTKGLASVGVTNGERRIEHDGRKF